MQIFVFEYFTGGGLDTSDGELLASPLLAEARGMVSALVADFCEVKAAATNHPLTDNTAVGQRACAFDYGLNEGEYLSSVQVVSTRDARLPPLHPVGCAVIEVAGDVSQVVRKLSAESDWTVLIAPEQDGELWKLAKLVESAGGRLLSPNSTFIEIASSKQATVEALARAAVPVPKGMVLAGGQALPAGIQFPVVIKPIDGCGSQGVRLVHNAEELARLVGVPRASHGQGRGRESIAIEVNQERKLLPQSTPDPIGMRVEEYVAGLPVSVSLLCGPGGWHALPACEQRLTRDGRFEYLGGRLPLETELDERARRLAMRAMVGLPATTGYVGFDLVLGHAADGSGDRVIEVNPRLTTSYVGLRAASQRNLAAAMLAVAAGKMPDLSFRQDSVIFTAAGDMVGE